MVARWNSGKRLQQVPQLLVEVRAVDGSAGRRSPSIAPTQMMTPIPAVKPAITGSGMKRSTPPNFAAPSRIRITPAMQVASSRPSTPYCAVTPARITTKAPVGPAIWMRLPPNSETTMPAMIAV